MINYGKTSTPTMPKEKPGRRLIEAAEEMRRIVRGEAKPASITKPGRPSSGKVRVTMLLDPDVIEKFKAAGEKGWQARINDVLKEAKL